MTITDLLKNDEIGCILTVLDIDLYWDGSEKGEWVGTKRKPHARKTETLLRTESETNAAKCFAQNVIG